MNLRVWVRHLDNFASLASAGLSLPTLRSHRHSPGASSCRQTRIIALSAIVSQYPVNPLYTRASPLLQVTQHLEKEGIHSATPTKSHTTHKDSITPSLQQSLSSYSPTHHQVVGDCAFQSRHKLHSASRFYCFTTTHRPCFAQRKEGWIDGLRHGSCRSCYSVGFNFRI